MTPEELLAIQRYHRLQLTNDMQPDADGAWVLWKDVSVELEKAKSQCVHLREARQVDMDMLDRMDREQVALSAKLQEAEKVAEAQRKLTAALEIAHAQAVQERHAAWNKLQEVQAERDAIWTAIERGWDIEPRAYFEKEAPTNGFVYPLAQAIHHLWKRELKERDGKPITEASRGEVAKACPWCHSHDVSRGLFGLSALYVCSSCGGDFTEPALWQRVTPSCQ